jgi:hypothetical protein
MLELIKHVGFKKDIVRQLEYASQLSAAGTANQFGGKPLEDPRRNDVRFSTVVSWLRSARLARPFLAY